MSHVLINLNRTFKNEMVSKNNVAHELSPTLRITNQLQYTFQIYLIHYYNGYDNWDECV